LLARLTLFLILPCLRKHRHKFMIRLFTVFCKLNFKTLSAKDLFLKSMEEFAPENLPFIKLSCPFCSAKNPNWSYHDSYPRYLISFENNNPITYIIDITRIICSSCKHTHAILPEIIIPHGSYSLIFILSVLKDYFFKMTIKNICKKYQISPSMLYGWKRLFLQHKKLWLGILEDLYQNPLVFLSSMLACNTSNNLQQFFTQTGHSFLQGAIKTARFNSS
jgi:hypothetical protein